MVDWEKYEVPDWVVDDYNSRASKEDRIPLGKYALGDSEDDWMSQDYLDDPECQNGILVGSGILIFILFAAVLSGFLS